MPTYTYDCPECCTPGGCCENAPDTLFATLTTGCPFLSGQTVELTLGMGGDWSGTVGTGDETTIVTLHCEDGVWSLLVAISDTCSARWGDYPGATGAAGEASCDPVDITFEDNEIVAHNPLCECEQYTISVVISE